MQKTVICSACNRETTLPPERDTGFCAHCGAKLTAGSAGYVQNTVNSGIYGEASRNMTQPVKKRGLKKILAVATALIVVIAAGVIGFSALGGSSYEKAEAGFIASLFKALPVKAGTHTLDFALEYSPGGYLSDYASVKDTALSGSITYNGEKAVAETLLSSAGQPVSSFIASFAGTAVSLSMPELTDYTLMMLTDAVQNTPDPSSLDMGKLKSSFTNIVKSYFASIEDTTTVTKGTSLSGGGVTVKCDEYVIDFTESAVAKIGLALIAELNRNENLMDFARSYAVSMDVGEEEFDAMLSSAYNELSGVNGTGRLFRMTVWVADGEVIARRINSIPGFNADMSYMLLSDGTNAYIEAGFDIEGSAIKLLGNFDKNGKTWDGEMSLTASAGYYYGELFSLKAICGNLGKSGKLYTGDISISGNFNDVMLSVELMLSPSGSAQQLTVTGSADMLFESIEFGTLSLIYELSSGGSVKIPPVSPDMCVIADDYSPENTARAEIMADELYELWLSGEYDDNMIISELIYSLWSMTDDIVWYSENGYEYDFDFGYDDYDFGYYDDYFDDDLFGSYYGF